MWTGNAAHAAATNWVGDSRAAVRLITATDHIAADSTLEAGLEFRFAKGWHGYWRTPGDAGIPPTVDWSASENISGADISWPAPHRLVIEELQNSVYENDVILPVKLHRKQAHTSVGVKASIGYAACSEVCVPLQAELALPLPSGAGGPSAESVLIDSAQKSVPGSPEAAGVDVIRARFAGTASEPTLVVDLQSKAEPFVRPDLFVEGAGNGIPPAPKVELQDAGKIARLTVRLVALPSPDRPLTLTLVDENRAAEFKGPAGDAIPAHSSVFFVALLSALLGGLILNLMPCVLPVLSIKLLAFTRQAGSGLRDVRLGSAATALGITTSFLLLAASLVGLKWSGATLGWGVQFQQPWFLAGMAVLTVLFAASFFEWLPIGLPSSTATFASKRSGGPLLEAFLTGMFATLLATLRAIRRYCRGLCVCTRAVRNLCNFPVSRHRNGPALLGCRVVSWLRSLASTSGSVDACCAEISRHLAVGDGGLADLRALERSGCMDRDNHDRSAGVLARLSSLDQCSGQRPDRRSYVAQVRMDYRRHGYRAPRLQSVRSCFSFAARGGAGVAGVQFRCAARAHRGRQHRAGGCHRHMVPDLQGQRVEGAGECGGSFADPTATRHKNARRLEPAEPIDRRLSLSLRTNWYSFRRGLRAGAATGRSPSRAAHHECPLACDRSSFSPGRQSQICGVRLLIPAEMMCSID
jgi:DsbC/DsbD-like thiol-disulfide interchange protein